VRLVAEAMNTPLPSPSHIDRCTARATSRRAE
jgi:hypothetical protein